MAAGTLDVALELFGTAAFEARAGSNTTATVDGAPAIGGEGRGMRPMEMLLTAHASCAAMDVLHILRKQKQPLEGLRVEAHATRADAVPARLTAVHLRFVASGDVADNKLQRAVKLGVEKYCSVGASLASDVTVTWEAQLTR